MTIKNLIFSALFTLASITVQAAPQLLDEVVAVVDDDVIMASELQQRMNTIRLQNRDGAMPDDDVLRDQVLERMILESIQLQMADRAGIRIGDAQLNEALGRIAAQNNMTLPQFRSAMEAEGVSFAQAREQIANEMRISRVQRYQVGERIQITDQDVDYFLASELGKMASAAEYHLAHILIAVPSGSGPSDLQAAEKKAQDIVRQLRDGADFRKMAIAQSSGRTALDGGDLGWRKEAQLPGIFAPVVPGLKVGQVSDPIKSASGYHIVKLIDKRGGNTKLITQAKTRHILIQTNELRDEQQAEALINQLYERLQAGEDFAKLAREFSDDPGSGSAGGDLGWVSPGDMVPEFDATMQATQPGRISAPFETQFGWHILEVEDRRQTDVGEETQRNQVRNMLYNRRFEEELPIWLRKIRSEAYVDIKEGV
ncbi:MAG: peptidylprolyl isomerase [Pseudomonadota bacterium]|nr:peptidylprolyl isomerase [Pseudomonadota bacterium]